MKPIRLVKGIGSFGHLAALLFFVEFVRCAFIVSFVPIFAAEQFAISSTAVGLAVSVHFVADTAVKIAAGYLLDRISPKLLLHLSMGCSLAGIVIASFGSTPATLIAGTMLLGLGVSPVWLLCLSRVQPEARGAQMGVIYTMWLAGIGLGPLATNLTLDLGYGVASGLLLLMLGAGWLAGLLWSLAASAPPLSSSGLMPMREQWDELRRKLTAMRPLLPGMLLQMAAAGLLLPILPTFATQTLGLDLPQYSLILIVGGGCAAACLIPMGRWSDKYGHITFFTVGFGGMAASLALLLFVPYFYAALLVAALLGLSCAAVFPSWNALLSRFVPADQSGTGWGVLSSVEGIGLMIGPLAGGWIADRYGAETTVTVSAAMLLAIALLYAVKPLKADGAASQVPGGNS